MFPSLKKFSNLFIILAIISTISSGYIFLFLLGYKLEFHLYQEPFVVICLLFCLLSGPALFTSLAIAFRMLHQDLRDDSVATFKRISDLKNTDQ